MRQVVSVAELAALEAIDVVDVTRCKNNAGEREEVWDEVKDKQTDRERERERERERDQHTNIPRVQFVVHIDARVVSSARGDLNGANKKISKQKQIKETKMKRKERDVLCGVSKLNSHNLSPVA